MLESVFPLPGVEHGNRILVSVIENRARDSSSEPWVSIPIKDHDLSLGYKDISFWQLNNYANHAAKWLSENLPPASDPFQCFAYAGPKDLRYPILTVAAAKLQKVVALPSPLVTDKAQLHILNAKKCTLYLCPSSMIDRTRTILRDAPHVQLITVPEIEVFMQEAEAESFTYPKSWEDGQHDPWLVFHTSGTTGNPKPITFTQRMMAAPDRWVVEGAEPGIGELFAHRRWYTPLPALHVIGTVLTLAMTSFFHSTMVIGPSTPPLPATVMEVLRYGHVQATLFPPSIIGELCLTPEGLGALRSLEILCYSGATLATKAGDQLASHTNLFCLIGSTEGGAYPMAIHDKRDAWNYVKFQKNSGVEFEKRVNDLYELVFVRPPGHPAPQVFDAYPDRDRFETNDLWEKHPVYEGLWKILGRTDDYVALSHGDGLYVSVLEPEIEAHTAVKSALIGGNGRPAPVLVVELNPEAKERNDRSGFISSLQPYIENVNARCHDCVKLSAERVVMASEAKPFVRTVKGSVSRLQTLDLYKEEIAALFMGDQDEGA